MAAVRFKVFLCKKILFGALVWIFFMNTLRMVSRKSDGLSWGRTNGSSEKENTLWKIQNGWRKTNSGVHIYSAYYDRRDGKNPFGMVQVLAFQPNSHNSSYYCFLVYKQQTICLKNPAERTTVFEDHRYYRTTMYSCYLPNFKIPDAVGLTTTKHCMDYNNTRNDQALTKVVFEEWSPMKDFGVCVHSPLFNVDDHQFVAEYVEMNSMLGAEWFTFYIYSISALPRKLLKSYEKDGLAELVDNWSDGLPTKMVHYKGQDLSVQDCLLRNMYKVKYLVFTDLDELIFPKKHPNWREMMNELEHVERRVGCFIFRHIAAFSNAMNLSVAQRLQHEHGRCDPGDVTSALKIPRLVSFTQRSVRIMLRRDKIIVKPLDVWRVRVHDANSLYGDKRRKRVNIETAVMYHYRGQGLETYINGSVYFDDVQKSAPELFKRLKKRLCKLK